MPAKKKPTKLKIVEGTYRADRSNPREPMPQGDLESAPEYLTQEEREVWDYAIKCAPGGLLKKLDFCVFEAWVRSYVFHRAAAQKVNEQGQVVSAPSGYPITNPYMSNMNRQAAIMLKAAAEMGFSPASRSKVVMSEDEKQDDPWAALAADA